MVINYYEMAKIPARHNRFRPTDNLNKKWGEYYQVIKNKLYDGSTFVLIGDRGNGKTQLACSVVGYVTTKLKKSGLYCKAQEIFLEIRAGMKGQDNKSEISAIEKFIKPYILVIDAFEVRGDTDFENRMIDHIIDKRYDSLSITIIISNDKKETIEKSLGTSIVDRISEDGAFFELVGFNFRRDLQTKKRMADKMAEKKKLKALSF